MKKLAVLAVAGLVSASASAVNWILVNEDTDAYYYIERDSIVKPKNASTHRIAFNKVILKQDQFLESGTYNTMISLSLYECSNPTRTKNIALRMEYNYDVIATYELNEPWKINFPQTVAEYIAKKVCSYWLWYNGGISVEGLTTATS